MFCHHSETFTGSRLATVKGLFKVRVEPFGVFGKAARVFSVRLQLNDFSLPSSILTLAGIKEASPCFLIIPL